MYLQVLILASKSPAVNKCIFSCWLGCCFHYLTMEHHQTEWISDSMVCPGCVVKHRHHTVLLFLKCNNVYQYIFRLAYAYMYQFILISTHILSYPKYYFVYIHCVLGLSLFQYQNTCEGVSVDKLLDAILLVSFRLMKLKH